MPTFSYRAIDAHGRSTLGRIDAANLADLDLRLRRMELDLIDGKPLGEAASRRSRRPPRRELINFCFHLEQLARAGVSLLDGLRDLRDSLEQPRFREVVAGLIEAIEGGQTLSQAMAAQGRVFDPVFVSLVGAGENSGCLPEVLERVCESLKWEDELAAQTKKVLLYPAFVGAIVIAATSFLMIHLVPQLKAFVSNMGQQLPLQTRALFFVSDLFVAGWYVAIPLLLVALVLVRFLLARNPLARLRFDALKLRLPLLGQILRKIILSRFATTLAMLYAAGIPLTEALRSTREVLGNLAIRAGVEEAGQLISEGRSVSAAFEAAGLFPPLVIRMLRIGENTGDLDRALGNVSYFYNRDVREAVEKVQQLIEPLLTVVLGGLLGWIMIAVLGPVYDVIAHLPV